MKSTEKAEIAKALYLTTNKTQKEICEIVGWHEKTFREQKIKGKWDAMREVKTMSKQQIITLLHEQTLQMIQAVKAEGRLLKPGEVDCIVKLTSSIDKLENSETIETYINVFEEYTKWLLSVNVALAQENNLWQDKFMSNKIQAEK